MFHRQNILLDNGAKLIFDNSHVITYDSSDERFVFEIEGSEVLSVSANGFYTPAPISIITNQIIQTETEVTNIPTVVIQNIPTVVFQTPWTNNGQTLVRKEVLDSGSSNLAINHEADPGPTTYFITEPVEVWLKRIVLSVTIAGRPHGDGWGTSNSELTSGIFLKYQNVSFVANITPSGIKSTRDIKKYMDFSYIGNMRNEDTIKGVYELDVPILIPANTPILEAIFPAENIATGINELVVYCDYWR